MKALLGCSWEVLVSRSCKILSSSSRSFHNALVGFCLGCPGMKILVKVCYNSLSKIVWRFWRNRLEGPCMILYRQSSQRGHWVKILKITCEKTCMKALLRCSKEVLVTLVLRSCEIFFTGGHSLTIFWNFLWGPGMRFWYEVLMNRHSVASCAKTSSCCCSYDDVQPPLLLFRSYCCLHLAHWLPTPHTFWGLLPV